MNMRKYSLLLGACLLLGKGVFADDAPIATPVPPAGTVVDVKTTAVEASAAAAVMEAKPAEWAPVEPAKDAKPITAVLMNKGAGNDALVIKSVSVCDANNVWCVANDGTKDGVYQLTAKGLERKFDGVFVSAGKEIVTAINDQKEVFVLKGGKGSDWTKIEGLKLSRVSRPSEKSGWGLLEGDKGVFSVFQYKQEDDRWVAVKNLAGADAKGIIDVEVNAEDIALMLTDKGEILKRDLEREELHEKAKAIAVEMKKEEKKDGGKAKKDKKGKQHKGKKAHKAEAKGEEAHADKKEHKGKHKGAGKKEHKAKHKGKHKKEA